MSRYIYFQLPSRLTSSLHCQVTSSPNEIENNILTPIGYRDDNGQHSTSRYWLESGAFMKLDSYILLSHVFTLPLYNFKLYRSKKGANNLRLDSDSYHQLMERLGRRNTEHCIDPNHTPNSHLSSESRVPQQSVQSEGSIQDTRGSETCDWEV